MSTLSEVLQTKLLPWSQQDAAERFIVAQKEMRQADMPYGVKLVPHKIQSKRVIVKKGRCYNQARNVIAEWPAAGLQEIGKYILVCVLDGHVNYQIGHNRLQAGPGNFIFIPPGFPLPDGSQTYVDLEKSTFCTIITFLLHPNSLECWMSHGNAEGRELSNRCLMVHERAVFLFEALMKEVMGGESKSLQMGEGLLNVFLLLLQREINAGNVQMFRSLSQFEIEPVKNPPPNFRAHLESYVQTNLRSPLTLNDVSAEMYYSRAQFVRVMRRETGMSFNEYLSERRLEEAKKLLLNSQWAVTVVATLVGFKSDSHFRTFFKRHVGMTPTEFRASGSESQD